MRWKGDVLLALEAPQEQGLTRVNGSLQSEEERAREHQMLQQEPGAAKFHGVNRPYRALRGRVWTAIQKFKLLSSWGAPPPRPHSQSASGLPDYGVL